MLPEIIQKQSLWCKCVITCFFPITWKIKRVHVQLSNCPTIPMPMYLLKLKNHTHYLARVNSCAPRKPSVMLRGKSLPIERKFKGEKPSFSLAISIYQARSSLLFSHWSKCFCFGIYSFYLFLFYSNLLTTLVLYIHYFMSNTFITCSASSFLRSKDSAGFPTKLKLMAKKSREE